MSHSAGPGRSLSGCVLALLSISTLVSACRDAHDAFAADATWVAPALPETPAGRRAATFFAALDAGEDSVRQFVSTGFTPRGPGGEDLAERADRQAVLARESGGLEVYEVVRDEPHACEVLARFRLTRVWRRLTVFTEEQPPHRVAGLMIVPAAAPEALRTQVRGNLAGVTDAYVRRLADADAFSGVVAISGGAGFAKAYNVADHDTGRPNAPDTRFGYASVGKMFTAVAVAQLVEAGHFGYGDTVGTLLPAYAKTSVGGLTVDQLLTHRGGLVDIFDDFARFEEVARAAHRHEDYFPLFADQPLRGRPGETFAYSNSGYMVLGAIVETETGRPLGDYLHERVFGPAGMTATTLDARDLPAEAVAVPYTAMDLHGKPAPGPRQRVRLFEQTAGMAAGGGFTTAADLMRFGDALAEHRLLSPRATAELFEPRTPSDRPGVAYGYGFYVREVPGGRVVGHSGGAHGVDAQFELYLPGGRVVVALANYEGAAAPVVEFVAARLSADGQAAARIAAGGGGVARD